ncbi:MAG: O-antigen ligase family protein [Deltaproteobacteria bacterium]|nr:O-antigen ligase family protein [Deltaproteobacteria bacterium]
MPRVPTRQILFSRLSATRDGLTRWIVFLGAVGGLALLVGGVQDKVHLVVILLSMIVGFFALIQPVVALFTVFVARGVLDLLWWIPGSVFGLNMLQLFSGAVAGLTATFFLIELKRFERHPCFRPFLVFAGLMALAFLRTLWAGSDRRLGTTDLLVQYTSPFLLLFLSSNLFRDRRLRQGLLLAVTVVGIFPIATSIYHYLHGQMGSYHLHGYFRLLGGYKNLHNHAIMMLIFASLLLFWGSFPRVPQALRIGALGLMGGAVFALYQTFIRTGMLGLAVFAVVFLVSLRRWPWLGLVLTGGALFVLLDPVLQERFLDFKLVFDFRNPLLNRSGLGSGRWGIWTTSLEAYLDQPLQNIVLGLGLGGHWTVVDRWVKGHQMFVPTLDPHNDFLLLLYQVGPAGLIAYVVLLWRVMQESRAVIREADGPWARLLGAFVLAFAAVVLVTNGVSNSFVHRTSPAWYFWGFAGLIFAERADLARRRASATAREAEPPEQGLARSSGRM